MGLEDVQKLQHQELEKKITMRKTYLHFRIILYVFDLQGITRRCTIKIPSLISHTIFLLNVYLKQAEIYNYPFIITIS